MTYLSKETYLNWEGHIVGVNQKNQVTVRNGKPYYILSKKYRDFIQELTISFYKQKEIGPYKKNIKVDILLFINKNRDIDNSIKPILDSLQKANIISNDKEIISLYIQKIDKRVKKMPDIINIKITGEI